MFDAITTIVEDMQQRANTAAPSNIAKVNKQETRVDSKRVLTALSGKQKEPNRGAGSDRKPSVPRAHRTGPTNEHAVVASHADSDGNSYSHVAATGNTHYIVQTHHNYTTLKRPIVSHEGPEKHVEKHWKSLVGESLDEAREKHTHKGHCQACGRQQAHESTGGIAKHGYTTEHGFFSGTCPGSGHKPLEHSHELCDHIQQSLHKDAKHHEKQVYDAKAGHTNPQIHSHTEYKKDEHGNRIAHHVHVPYKEAGQNTKESWHNKMLNRAHMSRSHAQMLAGLKKQIHGKPLVSAQHQAEVRKKASGERKAKTDHKDHLRSLAHQYDKHVNALQDHFLKIPHEHRTEAQSKVYYAPQFHHWSEKHSAAARKEFPAAKETIDAIDHLAAQRKALTKKEEVQMNDFEFKQLEEGIKAKMSPQDAHDFLTQHDAHQDFHKLPSETKMAIRDKSYEVGYHHDPKRANGSRSRYFHAALVRHARRGAVKEETVVEARKSPDYRDHSGKSGYHVMSHSGGRAGSVSWHKNKAEADELAKKMNYRGGTHHTVEPADDISKRGMGSSGTFKEDRSNEFRAHSDLSSSRSSRKPGHYLMKHGSPMHSEPHKDSAAALHAYKGLGDSKGVSIHHVKEDLEEVPGAVKTLSELKKTTLGNYVRRSANDLAGATHDLGATPTMKDASHHIRKIGRRTVGIAMAVRKLTKEGVEHSDHTKNIYHTTLSQHGFQHHSTVEREFAGHKYTQHNYTHPSHGKSHVVITHWHKDAKPHGYIHRHEQEDNGIMAPSTGDNKNQLHRSLSRHYGVPKGMAAPKLTKWEQAAKVAPYKMNEVIHNANFSGQGHDPEHQNHPLHATITKHGYNYSHSTPIGRPDGTKYISHTYKHSGHNVSTHSDANHGSQIWSTSTSTSSGHHHQGIGIPELEAHLKSKGHRYGLKKNNPVHEDAPGMSSGGAGDPGHVQNATDNYASQMGRRKNALKAVLRRKKPSLDETQVPNLAGHIPPEFDDVELGVVSPEQLKKNQTIAKDKLPKKVGPGGVDEATGQYSSHHSRAQWLRVATQHGYSIQPLVGGTINAHHPVHGYHVGTWSPKDKSGWISKPHPDWAKNESVEVNELSKKTLSSYVGKSIRQLDAGGLHKKDIGADRKLRNRRTGINRASGNLPTAPSRKWTGAKVSKV